MLVGIDIGGTKCAIITSTYDTNGKITILNKIKLDTSRLQPNEALEVFADKINELVKNERIDAIGISCGGPLDSKQGIIMSPPNLPGWDNIKITEYFEQKFHVPAAIENDANACALAEWKFGAAKGLENVVFLTFGTGLGAGIILDGKLYSGTNGMAGEVGHIRLCETGPVGYGKAGSFEGFCSGNGIAQIGKTTALEQLQQGKTTSFCKSTEDINTITAKKISEYAFKGYEDAKEVYKLSAQKLGIGLSVIIDILNPQMIVIGSVYARSEALMQEYTQDIIKKEALCHSAGVCQIKPAMLGDEIGDYAALAVAYNTLKELG